MRRGRPVDPGSLTQRVLAQLQDDQWKDTREIALAVGAPVRKVGDLLSFLQSQGTTGRTLTDGVREQRARLALPRLHEQREPQQRTVLAAHLDEAGLARQSRDLVAGHLSPIALISSTHSNRPSKNSPAARTHVTPVSTLRYTMTTLVSASFMASATNS